MNKYTAKIAIEKNIAPQQVEETLQLLEEGSTIPFIARYRKEQTGGLDEVQIEAIQKRNQEFEELENRRTFILETIEKQGKLTDELKQSIENAQDITTLEDLYLPYKKKRKTRADKAREKGLEPLAALIFNEEDISVTETAEEYITEEVPSVEEALEGARDIIVEWVNEEKIAREEIRLLFENQAKITSKVIEDKKEKAGKFKDYFKFSELLKECPSHRFLAMHRGMEEKLLRVSIKPPKKVALGLLYEMFVQENNEASTFLRESVEEGYNRLLEKSLENEFFRKKKEQADEEAIRVFSENLRQLLLEAPLGQRRLIAIDPGFRTGCKVVVLDEQGNLIDNTKIFVMVKNGEDAVKTLNKLIKQYDTEAIALGNGTASRETEKVIRDAGIDQKVDLFIVNEDGASIYSASEAAREEFPKEDVTVRGAVSIGRRLMDPLAELVKIDPKSIGVGQYQHDVDQKKLQESLERTVESCVNLVGVNANTASRHLLEYVSGLGSALAQNIVNHRTEEGNFKARKELLDVNKIGEKAFEQSAAFIRIADGENPLDNSAVHPESYDIVEQMAKDLDVSVKELVGNESLVSSVDIQNYVTEETGIPTLEDIIKELKKPGLDPRGKAEAFSFAEGINELKDLEEGMILPGIVTNITNFGAFVDIGVHSDGLVHISQLADKFVEDPMNIVSLREHVKVKVMEVDLERKRVSLSIKEAKGE